MMFAGQVIVGNCVSLTVTVKAQVAVLPLASVTLKTFVVTPTGNAEPLVSPAVCIVIGPEQLSAPVGEVNVATALHKPASFTLLMLAAQVIVGNSVSLTVTVNPQVAVLPLASVTLNTFVVTPTGNREPLARPAVCTVIGPEQLSAPVGEVKVAIALQSPASFTLLMLAGQVMVGNSVSVTVTVNPQVAVLPLASVTLNTFVVVPIGNAAPLATPAVCIVVWPGQLSAPIGAVYVATALQSPASFTLLMFAGQVIVGSWVSLTVTVKPQVAVLPLASVTLKTFVVVPIGNADPLGSPAVCIVV
jgi:hypothetical protein